MTDGSLPSSIWSGSFHIFGVELRCHVLDDGQRVIEEESMLKLLEAMELGTKSDVGDVAEFMKWQRG